MKNLLLVCIACLFLAGCRAEPDVIKREGQPDVVNVRHTDGEMNAAMEKARSTFPRFLDALQVGQGEFSIKIRFEADGEVEHIWMTDIESSGEKLWGRVGNEPTAVTGIAFGDRVRIKPSRISDWLIMRESGPVGGYTLRVLMKRMPAEDRAALVQQLGGELKDL